MLKDIKKKINEQYLNSEISSIQDGDLDVAMDNSEEISEKITNAGPLKKYAEIGKLMFGMLKDYKDGEYNNIPKYSIAAIVFSLLYIFNPFDIVPDFIPGLGYVDDLTVFATSLKFLQTDLHQYLDWKIDKTKE